MSDEYEHKLEAKSEYVADTSSVSSPDIDAVPEAELADQELYHSHSWWTTYVFSQDAKYIGLEPHNWVTAWIAVTNSNEENGCMRMWPGSHKEDLKNHEQKFDEDNLLTRGQTIENVPIEETDPVILKAGQMSLHHPTVIHGSGLNRSNDRRIGFVVQSYIGSNVDQVLGKIYVQKARGEDTHKFHEYSNVPKGLMAKDDIIVWNKAKDELSKIFYSGATKKGKY